MLQMTPMLRQMQEITLRQILHVRIANNTQRFNLMISLNDVEHYDFVNSRLLL